MRSFTEVVPAGASDTVEPGDAVDSPPAKRKAGRPKGSKTAAAKKPKRAAENVVLDEFGKDVVDADYYNGKGKNWREEDLHELVVMRTSRTRIAGSAGPRRPTTGCGASSPRSSTTSSLIGEPAPSIQWSKLHGEYRLVCPPRFH